MPLKVRKPLTPGQRGLVLQTTDDITQRKPKKVLLNPLKKREEEILLAVSPLDTEVGATKNGTELSTLRGIILVSQELLRPLNTTRIGPLGSH